ncbi:MAG: ATP-dependent helicase, partial [Candidatus Gastranaerophilales bacterium]|nr:ATP-dependent helicase [Candidatus Gastranaerophilales bacterium]
KYILIILKLCSGSLIKEYELKTLLINLLKIPYKKCIDIINEYLKNHTLQNYNFIQGNYNFAYIKFISLINSLLKSNDSLSNKIQIIYSNLIKEFDSNPDKEKCDFLIKEAESFEAAFNKDFANVMSHSATCTSNLEKEFITQIENSIISENPVETFKIIKDAVIVSSPQKIIDFSIMTKYQIWLDISSGEWRKQDTGTLYNAWVLNRDWDKKEYTLEDNISLTLDKTARIVRKLILCAKEYISFYSSLYDNIGNENFGGLEEFIISKQSPKQELKIIPREDQKPVLDYKKGKMGIMAVPGAGKTTILLALIVKLIKEGINPEKIFVLTYMEAAAKNFKERIKAIIPDSSSLPNISTIHGLALRIIKENGNYNKAGLDEDFEICDDTQKEKFIKELFYKFKIDNDKYDDFLRCITIVKLSQHKNKLYSKFKEIQEFYTFFNEYNCLLKQNNLIDYDDMLCFALKILEENPEILNYYQNICEYVIEDEAQDSTKIQQRLIALLNGKYNNFIRCGDFNQAITSTFTNSDIESFKKFTEENQKVEMVSSQRCSEPIFTLANKLIKAAAANETSKNAFYQTQITKTDKNPISEIPPQYNIFNTSKEEKLFIVQKIKETIQKFPDSSIAVLLRLNSQVNEYNELFSAYGIKTSIRTDCLSQKNIYKIIHAMLNIIQNPFNNSLIISLLQVYKENNIYNFNDDELNYIKSIKIPFIKLSPDEINNEGLLQLYWDIDYWLNNSAVNINTLTLNIGIYYAENTVDKSNAYMVSVLLKRLISENDTFEEAVKKLEYASQKPLSAYKFYEDENNNAQSAVSIMTMHKSKGDEFDYVFIPELNEENYPLNTDNVKLKSGGHFIQTIRKNVENTEIKSPLQLKTEQVNETLRLLYVGITRAKKALYMSVHRENKRNKNIKISKFINQLTEI